jgi:protein-S-isoprenylcysteine O-methyltransferase Ste14
VRQWLAPIVPPELDRPVYVWIASLLFMLVCAAWRPLPGTAWRADDLAVWALRALQAAGLWLMVRSAAILDIWALAGLRPQAPGPSEFKVQGPYGWIRHPIYAGWFLFVFSASPMTMTRLVFAIVSGAYLLIAIPLEERTIRAATGDAYDRYIAAVRWKLVPGLY